jgi:tetratricopeptide (TPR) repeat protein
MNGPEDLHARALDRLVDGDVRGAVADLEAHLARCPRDADAWLHLGSAHEADGRWPEAARAHARAVELGGGRLEARLGHARALAQQGELEAAAAELVAASRAAPGEARVLRELGLVRYEQRRLDEAADCLTRAAAAAPDDARASFALGLAHEARRDLGAALAAYREATRRDPGFLDARRTLADALASLGEHEAAIAELEAVLAIDRRDEQAARNRDVLRATLDEMLARRLLGKTAVALEQSALVAGGQLRARASAGGRASRFGGPGGVELWVAWSEAGAIEALTLVLADPARAGRTEDDVFGVTVLAEDGRRARADWGTAVSLTFLREALGCPMTGAAALYARVAGGLEVAEWGGATVRLVEGARPDAPAERRPGLEVRLSARGASLGP